MFTTYVCLNCNEVFMKEQDLMGHIKRVHKSSRRETELFTRAQASDFIRQKREALSIADIIAMFFVGVLVTLLCAFVVEAQEVPKHRRVPVAFYCIAGSNLGSVDLAGCLELIRRAKAHYRSTANIQILARRIAHIGDPAPHLTQSPANALPYLRELEAYFAGTTPNRLKYFITQPFMDQSGANWIVGYTNRVCSAAPARIANAISYSSASYFNQRGEPRFDHSLNALVHELGHAFGAAHSAQAGSVMHANALAYVSTGVLPWHYYDLDQIFWCLNKRR